jgi:ankyrin repeat protein
LQEKFIETLDPSSSGTYHAQVYTSLASAIFSGNSNVAELLLTKTTLPIDHQGRTGNTALMFAAQWGQAASVEYLLKSGADVTLTNADGDTALALAMKNGQRDIAVLLRSYGAV